MYESPVIVASFTVPLVLLVNTSLVTLDASVPVILPVSSTSGTSTYRIINKTTGFDQVVVIVNIDSRRNRPFIAKKDYKSLVKNIKTTFYHETRHAVDQIVKLRNLSYEDFENTAMLQAWINVEFEETLMDYITEGELEEVISESVKKR